MIGNKFVFVAPMYNASSTLARMLHSICGQSYQNWKIILIDDVSSQNHIEKCVSIIDSFEQFTNDRLSLILNRNKKWEVANVLHGISLCNDDDIICRIDADDALCDLDALTIMNSVYTQTNCEVAWSMHRWGMSDRNISAELPQNANPYVYNWVSSHLKTFRKRLINNIPYENFTNMNGDLIKRCGDQAIYLPILSKTNKRIFVPRALYSYTINEQGGAVYQTDDAKFQKEEADFIRQRGYVTNGPTWEEVIKL